MKYVILLAIIYFVYRFYNKPKKIDRGTNDFPGKVPLPEEEDLGDYTEYEELE